MSKQYLRNEILVQSEDKLVYKLVATRANETSMYLYLELVCGWDYTDPDRSDAQGWIPAKNFIEEAQTEFLVCNIFAESIAGCLRENGFTTILSNPLNH